jgi:hypothetical protein
MRPAQELEVDTWSLFRGKKKKAKLNCRGDMDTKITAEAGFVCSQTATADVLRAEISETFCIIQLGKKLWVDISI